MTSTLILPRSAASLVGSRAPACVKVSNKPLLSIENTSLDIGDGVAKESSIVTSRCDFGPVGAAVRTALQGNLPWSPLDYVRGISVPGDKALYLDRLTKEIPPEDDLRFVGPLATCDEAAVFAGRLPWDSAFFGYGVARLDAIFPLAAPFYRPYADYTSLVQELINRAREREIRYLFAQVDSRDLATLRALGAAGFCVIETRIDYYSDLTSYTPKERFPVRAAVPEDIPSLGRAAQETVNQYDRFHADPFIKPEDADRLMVQWIKASILESFADITIVPDVPSPAAFTTVRYHRDKWEQWGLKIAQPVLTAVSPEFKGWYRRLISETNLHLQEQGVERVYHTTQVTNRAIIWVWESFGNHLGRSELVLRRIL